MKTPLDTLCAAASEAADYLEKLYTDTNCKELKPAIHLYRLVTQQPSHYAASLYYNWAISVEAAAWPRTLAQVQFLDRLAN